MSYGYQHISQTFSAPSKLFELFAFSKGHTVHWRFITEYLVHC